MTDAWPIPLAAPLEAWGLWFTVVALGALVGLVLAWLRRRFLRPMRHRPSSTTDAWAEAGRRFRSPEAVEDDDAAGGNGDAP